MGPRQRYRAQLPTEMKPPGLSGGAQRRDEGMSMRDVGVRSVRQWGTRLCGRRGASPGREGHKPRPPPSLPPATARATAPSLGQATPGVVKQDKSSGGSVDTAKTRSGPQRVRLSSGERPIGTAKGKQSDTEALCQTPYVRSPCRCLPLFSVSPSSLRINHRGPQTSSPVIHTPLQYIWCPVLWGRSGGWGGG